MKSNLPTGLSAICLTLLIVLLVLQTKQQSELETLRQEHRVFVSTMEKNQQEAHAANVNLAGKITNLGGSMEARLTQSKQQAEAFLNKLQEQGSTNSAELLQAIFQVSYDLCEKLTNDLAAANAKNQQSADKFVGRVENEMREMRQQLDDLVNSGALFPDKTKPALDAVALAKASEQAGDTNLAKIYYLSAVNHAPSEFSYLKDYADTVFRDPAAATEDFARLKSVLQISLYQIPPANVTKALALLSETEQRENQLIAAQTPKPVPVNWLEQFDQLTNALPLDATWSDLKKLSKRWEGLNQIAESLREESLQTNLLGQVENEAQLTQNVLTASHLALVVDTIFHSLDSSVEQQPEKAVSQLQTAEETLGQLWGIDFNIAGYPKALSDKVDAYPKAIQNYVEKVAEVKSRPFVNQIRDAVSKAKSYKTDKQLSNKFQKAWENYDHCLSDVRAATGNISSSAGRKEAENAYQVIGKLANDIKRRQFDAYQKWAIGRCEDAFDTYNSFTTMTREHAWQCFNDGHLAKIDQSLLSPDVSRMFNDVMSKITVDAKGHMWGLDGVNVFSMQQQCAEAQKVKLEDF